MNSNSVQHLFQAACKAQQAQQSRKAISKFESVLALAPTHIDARFRLASMLFQGGAPERAAKEFETLIAQAPDNSELRVRQAQVLSALGDGEGCASALEQAVRIDPANIAGTSSGSALVGSMEWNSYHLFRDGEQMVSNRALCPVSAGLVDLIPFPHIRGHSPEIFLSRLRPNTQIEPHFGLMNVRLTVHLALNIPTNAGIRVGSETRTWTPGKVLAFDDSFNHEAWNNSDEERIVLIFESWNPDVSAAERFGIEQFFQHRQGWLEQFNDDALLPAQGIQPRLQW